MIFDNVLKNVPHHVFRLFHGTFRRFDVVALTAFHKTAHNKRLEQLYRHFLGQAALINFQVGSYNDNRTSRIVHTFTQQVLTETSLFTAEHGGERFQLSVRRSGECFSSSAVIDQRVHSFLQHTLFVFDDHFRSGNFHHLLEAVIAVDNAAIQIVQIGRSESAAVQLYHRTDIRRYYGKHGKNHPFGAVAALSERFHHFQTLDSLYGFLPLRVLRDDLPAAFGFFIQIHRHQKFADRFRAHAYFQTGNGRFAVFLFDFAQLLFGDDLFYGKFVHAARIEHHVFREIKHFFQRLRAHIEKQTDFGRHAFKIPDMRNGSGQFDMPHTLSSHLAACNFHAALLAHVPFIFHSFIFSAMAFPILHRPEDFFAEQTVAFGFLGAVIDGFRLRYFAVRPFSDFFRRRNTYLNGIEIV